MWYTNAYFFVGIAALILLSLIVFLIKNRTSRQENLPDSEQEPIGLTLAKNINMKFNPKYRLILKSGSNYEFVVFYNEKKGTMIRHDSLRYQDPLNFIKDFEFQDEGYNQTVIFFKESTLYFKNQSDLDLFLQHKLDDEPQNPVVTQ